MAAAAPASTTNPLAGSKARVIEAYGKLPLSFEANRGQTDSRVQFLSRGSRQTLFLAATEAVLVLTKEEDRGNGRGRAPKARLEEPTKVTQTALRMAFLGADPDAHVTGEEEMPGKANYFIGNDPKRWRTDLPTFGKVRYVDLYPDTDVIYYGTQGQLEYDIVVRPGADPSRIALSFEGAERLEVDGQGDLVLHTAAGAIRQRQPVIYQKIGGHRVDIRGGYVLKHGRQVGFEVAAYDRRHSLVIDPVLLSYSSYLGGGGDEAGEGIAVDGLGNAYVTGWTRSTAFPTRGAFQHVFSGSFDAFVAKVNPRGSALVYSTYLGGSDRDFGAGIAVDGLGNAFVTGLTFSSNFPTTPGAFQPTAPIPPAPFRATAIPFVAKLDATGSALVYSTYLGTWQGRGCCFGCSACMNEVGEAIAVDGLGNAYVTGFTTSTNFPTTPGAFQPLIGGGTDAFVAKVNPAGSALVYSSYLGGSGFEDFWGIGGIAVDGLGNAYVTGSTTSTNFPTTLSAFQPVFGGATDTFVAKVNPTGSALVYSSYLGGSGFEEGRGIAVDGLGNAYVTGSTTSTNFSTTPGAFQPVSGGGTDAFVAKITAVRSYTFRGLASGMLGNQAFSNRHFEIVVEANPRAIFQFTRPCAVPSGTCIGFAVPADVANVALFLPFPQFILVATITSPVGIFDNQTFQTLGLSRISTGTWGSDLLNMVDPAFATYTLDGALGPIGPAFPTDTPLGQFNCSFGCVTTDAGVLTLDSVQGVSFTVQ